MGESEEAGCRTLSSHGPENPEEKEIVLSLRKWVPNRNKKKHRILHPALLRGKERRCSCGLLRKSKLQHLRVARIRAAWCLAGTRGSGGRCIMPGQDVLDRLGLLLYRRELLGEALDGVAEQPPLGDGGVEKACLPEGPCCDFRRLWSEVSHRAQLLHQPPVGTTLVHLFECLGMVNLQDSHGVQGRGCLARSTISFSRESGCQPTGLGRETWTFLQVAAFVGTGAPRPLSLPGECPRTPWQPCHRR